MEAASPIDARQARGLALVKAQRAKIKHVAGSRWLVPSQTNASGGYVVDVEQNACTCPDHEDRGVRCKHIWAVMILRSEVTLPDGTTVVTEKRITYRQDWPAYNAAQTEERDRVELLLKGLCDGIVQPPRSGRGRPPALLADIVYAATMKTYGTMPGRRSTCDIRACAADGLLSKAPAYNTLFKYAERAELAPLLKTLVHESAAPLRSVETTFATDSTGFATNTYARWFDEKYGAEKRCQRWIKLHAQVGTLTNVIASVEATESNVGDPVMLKPLLDSSIERGFDVRELSADKAYLGNDNLVAIEAVHAVPYIPFKSNSKGTGRTDAWRRLWHMFEARNDEFLSHYHKRSNVREHVLDDQAQVRRVHPRQDVPGAGERSAAQVPLPQPQLSRARDPRAGDRSCVLVAPGGPLAMTVARKLQNASDLNTEEQHRVRGAIRHLHARVRDWMLVAKSLRFARSTVTDMVYGRTPVSASMAFRVARFLGAPIDDLLAGRFTPPETCPYCKQPVPESCPGYAR